MRKCLKFQMSFTFHYVSIKTHQPQNLLSDYLYLHSTMYLLKPLFSLMFIFIKAIFTFHYVSIKTSLREMIERMIQLFTFHYVSIKTKFNDINIIVAFVFTFHYVSIKTMKILFFTLYLLHLHSTMYLLKLPAISKITSFYSVFTFHYVSIKTKTRLSVRSIQNYLHSTMYLLKPVTLRNNHFLHTIYIPLCIY